MSDRFLRACGREAVDCTPVWLMRQAGRYMPEYRRLREKHSMLDLIRTPELAAEVTLQPIKRFELDAAIIFADLLPPLMGMGVDLSYAAGEGPVIHNPVRSAAGVAALRVPSPEENTPFTLQAIRIVSRELAGKVPLIGFAGAPFTLASYLVEGGGSRELRRTKQFMHAEPDAWRSLMDKLARLSGEYLAAQIAAGAQAVQLFDSWAGALSPADYAEYVLPATRDAIRIAQTHAGQPSQAQTQAAATQPAQAQGAHASGVPVIYFSTETGGMLERVAEIGCQVIGIDWRTELGAARARLGPEIAVQGNLDPAMLFAPLAEVRRRTAEILTAGAAWPGHIFNLGHGVLPETPVETVQELVDFVHEWRPTD